MTAEQDQNEPPRPQAFRVDAAEARQRAEFIASRAWGLARNPNGEWEQIRNEETTVPAILAGYVAPLAALPPVCGAIGQAIFGERIAGAVVRADVSQTLIGVLVTFLASIALVYFLGLLINAIADNFDGEQDPLAAQKVAAYSMTPIFVSGVFSLWPPVWWITIIGVAMSAFLFYRGLAPLMRVEPERALGYAATVMLVGLVATIILFGLGGCLSGVGGL